jgi:hypothetical protein
MRTWIRGLATIIAALGLIAIGAGSASAFTWNITWLNMSPTPFGSSVPNNSVFFLPGVGNVTVTYSISSNFNHARTQNACFQNGTLLFSGDTYSWVSHELFAATLLVGPDPLVPEQWAITYTFPSTQVANSIFVGVAGLGSTTSFGGGTSKVTVNQNGTFVGDWSGGCGPWGPTQFTGGPGTFQMQNSLTGPGGQDPHWNTPLGVVQINDAVSSITAIFDHIRGDGIGLNIGYAPGPPTSSSTGSWGRLKTLYR